MAEGFPGERQQRLDVLAGVWRSTITMIEADGKPGAVSAATDTYSWLPGRHFLLHDVDAVMNGEQMQSIEIIAVDPESEGYLTRSYDAGGTISDFRATLDGAAWRISGESERFEGRFSEDGQTLEGQWERLDAGRWMPWISMLLEKRPG